MDIEKAYVRIGSAVFYDGKPISWETVIDKLNTLERFETESWGCCRHYETVALQNKKLLAEIKVLLQP